MNQPKNRLSELLEQSQPSDPETPEPTPMPKSYQSPARQGKKMISGYFDPAVQHQLQVIKLETGKSIQKLLCEGINAIFTMHDKPPIAK